MEKCTAEQLGDPRPSTRIVYTNIYYLYLYNDDVYFLHVIVRSLI